MDIILNIFIVLFGTCVTFILGVLMLCATISAYRLLVNVVKGRYDKW